MVQVGRRIYYDNQTGIIIFEIGEQVHNGERIEQTIDRDIESITTLSERNRESFDVIELPFGAFSQDFLECSGYRVNPTTKEIEFTYPDPNKPEAEPVYRQPLSEEVEKLKQEDLNNKEAIAELYLMTMGGI